MATPPVQTLLAAVRRRLWRGQFVVAARRAAWLSAGLLLLAAATHLAARPVGVDLLLSALAAAWFSMLARATWQRPADPACALWADRHLGGASAFSTMLELRQGAQPAKDPQALRWLESWTTARVPQSLRLLAGRAESTRLARPLLSMLACAALTAVVLALPPLAPSPREPVAAASAPGTAERPMSAAEAPARTQLVDAVASALRSAQSREATEGREAGRSPAAGARKPEDPQPAASPAQPGATPAAAKASGSDSTGASAADAARMSAASQSPGTGTGRDAGDSPDERADARSARAPQGRMQVQGIESMAARAAPARQADMQQSATYDDEPTLQRGQAVRADLSAVAATPPAATQATRLTPTQTSYVQAWMKASEQRR